MILVLVKKQTMRCGRKELLKETESSGVELQHQEINKQGV